MINYERYSQIRNIRQLKDAQVATIADIGKSTFSDWKSGRSVPKDDKIRRISMALNVSPEYLKGDCSFTICPVCGLQYDLLNNYDFKNHKTFHDKILKIKEKYSFCDFSSNLSLVKENSIWGFRDIKNSLEKRLEFWHKYLETSYCLELSRFDYDITNLSFEDYCKTEVASLQPDYSISEEFIEILADKYGVNKEYMDFVEEEAQLLARLAQNKQLLRIVKMAEKLPADILNSIEIQIEALSKLKKEDS